MANRSNWRSIRSDTRGSIRIRTPTAPANAMNDMAILPPRNWVIRLVRVAPTTRRINVISAVNGDRVGGRYIALRSGPMGIVGSSSGVCFRRLRPGPTPGSRFNCRWLGTLQFHFPISRHRLRRFAPLGVDVGGLVAACDRSTCSPAPRNRNESCDRRRIPSRQNPFRSWDVGATW